MVTPDQLAELRWLAEAATPGPWESSHNVDPPSDDNYRPNNPNREGRGEGPTITGTYRDVKAMAAADAAFIAAARTAVPALCAEVERLTAQVAALEAERDVMSETILGEMIAINKQLLQHVAALTRERDEALAKLAAFVDEDEAEIRQWADAAYEAAKRRYGAT